MLGQQRRGEPVGVPRPERAVLREQRQRVRGCTGPKSAMIHCGRIREFLVNGGGGKRVNG